MSSTMTAIEQPKVASHKDWLIARKDLLAKEKEFTHLRDELSRQRRQLPWEKVEKNYVFEGPSGKETFADLFGKRSQLVIYHFMFAPGWSEGCPSCSYLADHFDGTTIHLANRDVTFAVVSRAPVAQIEAFKKRMGWKFKWVSSFGSDFNYDYHVSFSPEDRAQGKVEYNYAQMEFPSEEAPGLSVFARDSSGDIFHTYSSYSRGLDIFVGTYNFLDHVPKGRDEDGLKHSMAWVRHHDKYTDGYVVDPTLGYVQPETVQIKAASSSCCSEEHHS
ncbi:MAG: thioredoxin family protein [Terracidiphilus sp.]